MTAEFYAFNKKRNSTKQPALNSGTTYTVELKDDTSILNPVLLIAVATIPVPTVAPVNVFTYCYIQKFNRYYFVDDWVYIGGIWEAHLSIDVLASHKNEIGSTSAYIERSASAYDGDIMDGLYPTQSDYDIQVDTLAFPYSQMAPSGGTYIVGIINSVANTAGAVTYYAMNQTELQNLLAYMFGNDIWNASGITDITQGLFKSMFNPIQYIVSCMWFPFAKNVFGSTTSTVYLGYYQTSLTATLVTTLFQKTYVTGTIPVHPQAASRGNYLNYAPYTDVTLYLAPFGSIPVDPAFLKKGNYLNCPLWIDSITGECTIRVSMCQSALSLSELNVSAERSAKLGVPIQLSQVLADYSHTIQTMQSGLSGGIAGIIAGAIGATVQSGLDAKFPSVSTSGSNGSFMAPWLQGLIITKHALVVDGDNTDLGRPLMSVRTINTLSGYIKCAEAHFSSPCLSSERGQIEDLMKSGFFYE